MNFRATYKELSSVASFFGERQLLLKYDGVNQFSLHTKESVFLFSLDIDWYFKLERIEGNIIYFKMNTSGWASRKGLRKIFGSKYGVQLKDNETLIIDLPKVLPYKFRRFVIENMSISETGIELNFIFEES